MLGGHGHAGRARGTLGTLVPPLGAPWPEEQGTGPAAARVLGFAHVGVKLPSWCLFQGCSYNAKQLEGC